MTLEAFATIADLETRWRTLTTDEKARAEVLLGDASNLIRELSGDVYESPDELQEATLIAVTCEAVKRVIVAGVDTQPAFTHQQMNGPFSEMHVFQNPSGDLYITANEKKRLGIGRRKIAFLDMAGCLK